MNISKCISDICEFPVIYNREDKAPLKILEDCGYNEYYEDVTLDAILEYLKLNPSLINNWLQYSEDIRWSPAWSFGQEQGGLWKVRYYDRNGLVETRTFEDTFKACATMIKMTAEEIRK